MLKLTKPTQEAKMDSIPSLNTSALQNDYCIMMSKTDAICKDCYSRRAEKCRRTMENNFIENSTILSSDLLTHDEIKQLKINSVVFRFHSFGELINEIHFLNFLAICEYYPLTMFSLWSKRSNIIQKVLKSNKKPKNLRIVYSNPTIDNVMNDNEIPKYFDQTFNVVKTTDLDKVNCVGHCFDCQKCYGNRKNITIKTIVEKIK